jgi:hypothetical protein
MVAIRLKGMTAMFTKSLVTAAAVGLVLAQSPARAGADEGLAGLWNVRVTLTNCATGEPLPFPGATFDALALFERDGTMHDTNVTSPPARSSGFGVWRQVSDRAYRFAFKFFQFDATGATPTGSTVVRHRLRLAENGGRYSSRGTAEFYDVSGIRQLPDGCSTSTATRFR